MVRVSEVNNLEYERFVKTFENIVEASPFIAAAMWEDKPFYQVEDMQKSAEQLLAHLPQAVLVGILRGLPDLGGKKTFTGQLSSESTREQRSAGLETLTTDEKAEFDELNSRYKEKFGFPFVLCARENKKEAVMKGMAMRVHNDRLTEILTAVHEVKKICHLRLIDIVAIEE